MAVDEDFMINASFPHMYVTGVYIGKHTGNAPWCPTQENAFSLGIDTNYPFSLYFITN